MAVATRESWKTSPCGEPIAIQPCNWVFPAIIAERMLAGFVPRDMDDKWFIFAENSKLWLFRSWTGTLAATIDYTRAETGAVTTSEIALFTSDFDVDFLVQTIEASLGNLFDRSWSWYEQRGYFS